MADFDVYRSVGPNVDVRLFGDAATQGAALGKSIPSFLQSAIQGGVQGVATGQKLVSQDLQNQWQQNRVDMLPTANRAQIAEADNAQSIAEINALHAELAKQTQDLTIQDRKAKLENDVGVVTDANKLRTRTNDFITQFGSADPSTQAEMYSGGQWNDVLGSPTNRELDRKVGFQVWQNPNNNLDPSQRAKLQQSLKIKGLQDDYQKQAAKALPVFTKGQDLIPRDALTTALHESGQMGDIPFMSYPDEIEPIDAYRYRTEGGKLQRNPDNTLQQIPEAERDPTAKGKYSIRRKGTDDIILSGVNDTSGIIDKGLKLYGEYTVARSQLNGEDYQKAVNQLNNPRTSQNASQQQSSVGNIPTLGGKSSGQAISQTAIPDNELLGEFQKTFNLKDTEIEPLKETANQLKIQADIYASNPALRNSVEVTKNRNAIVNSMARQISDSKFRANPTLKQFYPPGSVANWNESLGVAIANARAGRPAYTAGAMGQSIALGEFLSTQEPVATGVLENRVQDIYSAPSVAAYNRAIIARKKIGESVTSSSQFLGGEINPNDPLYTSFAVNTPEDVYFADNQHYFIKAINDAFYSVADKAVKTQTQPVNSRVMKNVNNQKLAAIANGQ